MSNILPQPPSPDTEVLIGEGFSRAWSGWFRRLSQIINGNLGAGFTGTIVTAKLTTGGANGSMTFVNGILTSETAAT